MFIQLIVCVSIFMSLEGAEYCEGIDYNVLDDPTRNEKYDGMYIVYTHIEKYTCLIMLITV